MTSWFSTMTGRRPRSRRWNVDLLVGGLIHEDVIGAVLAQVRRVATVDGRGFDLQAALEGGLVDGLAGQNILILVHSKARVYRALDNSPELAADHHNERYSSDHWSLPQWYLTQRNNQRSVYTRASATARTSCPLQSGHG